MTATTAPLASRALVRLAGPDWRSFLQGLITQNLADPGAGPLVYAALLAPQGRLLHDFFVWTTGPDEAVLDVDAKGAAELGEILSRYRLRARVTLEAAPGRVEAAYGGQPPGEGWRPDPRLPALGWRRLRGAAAAGPADLEAEAAFEALRLEQGVGEAARDGRGSDYPLELNLDLLNAIDFKKGCFVGQETTSRMHRRGGVRSRLVKVAFEGAAPPFGAEILAGELRAGEMRSGAAGTGLALLRLDRALQGPLTAGGRALRLDPPAWLAPSLGQPLAANVGA
jgi:folate-binding protein YgfZ